MNNAWNKNERHFVRSAAKVFSISICFFLSLTIHHEAKAHSIPRRFDHGEFQVQDDSWYFVCEHMDTALFSNNKGQEIRRALSDLPVTLQSRIQSRVNAIQKLNTPDHQKAQVKSNDFLIPLFFIAVLLVSSLFISRLHSRIQTPAIFITCISTAILVFGFTDPAIVTNAFLPFYPEVNTHYDSTYFYVESRGIPQTHEMMVGISDHGWQQQVPVPQCYIGDNAWSIPLNPVISDNPVPVDQIHFTRGAVAIAVNGVPIFNPYTNTGVDAYLDGQLDHFGGHCGRGDDYHYHTAPLHLYNHTSENLPIAYAFDGFAVYGSIEPDGQPMQTLDNNHGHYYNGEYHYHGTADAPYMIERFAGVVQEDSTHQLIPQAHAQPVRTENWGPLNGALITSCSLNSNANGYNVEYMLNGVVDYATNYHWSGNQYTFEYVTPNSMNTIVYNGFFQCEVPLSLMEQSDEMNPEFFPNPFSECLSVKGVAASAQFDLYNISGKWLMRAQTPQDFTHATIPSGMYFIKTTDSKIIRRLIKY